MKLTAKAAFSSSGNLIMELYSKHQLDYILASQGVAARNPDVVPGIVRSGQPYRVPGIESVKRYPRIGFDRPKASDHCPVIAELNV